MVADAVHPCHFVGIQRSFVEGCQSVFHHLAVIGTGQADVDCRVRQGESIAIGGGRGFLTGKHPGIEQQFAPTGGGEGDDSGTVRFRKMREYIPFGTVMGGVISDVVHVEDFLRFHLRENFPAVAGQRQEADFALAFHFQDCFKQGLSGAMILECHQEDVDIVGSEGFEAGFHDLAVSDSDSAEAVDDNDGAIAAAADDAADSFCHGVFALGTPVQVIDAALECHFDSIRGDAVGGSDTQPSDGKTGATEDDRFRKVGSDLHSISYSLPGYATLETWQEQLV